MKAANISPELKKILCEFGIGSIITTDMDYIDVNDIDTISFTPLDKVDRIKGDGRDPWKTNRVPMKIGKFFNRILFIESSELENLVNWYKTSYYIAKGDFSKIFSIVEGEDVRHWYNVAHYVPGGGSLNASCMRMEDTTNRLGLYVENPNVIKLLIMTLGDKLLSRALMWTTNNGIYIDRPYCRFDKDQMLYKKFSEMNKYYNYYDRTSGQHRGITLSVKVKKHYENRPYLDSFGYNNKVLTTNV